MYGIGSIGIHSSFASQGSGMNGPSGLSGGNFNLASLTSGLGQPVARGVSSAGTGSLGSQTVSTLLQTQDLSQTQIRGGGHGGGGGHHGMKMTAALDTEETAEAEETSMPHQTKKNSKTILSADTNEVAESEEEGAVTEEGEAPPQNAPHTNPCTTQ